MSARIGFQAAASPAIEEAMDTNTVSSAALVAYRKCCDAYKIKPNAEVVRQLDIGVFRSIALRTMDCSKTILGINGTKALLDWCRIHQGLERLILNGNAIDTNTVTQIIELLKSHKSLRSIDLSKNDFSTPTARCLLELVKNNHRVCYLGIEQCGMNDEWIQRIQKQVTANAELREMGYHPVGLPRAISEWATVFLCVSVGAEMMPYAHLIDSFVLPSINDIAAPMRFRVATLVLDDGVAATRTPEKRKEILGLCRDAQNHFLPWLLVFHGTAMSENQRSLVREALEGSPSPVPPPLVDRLGNKRLPMYMTVPHVFFYHIPNTKPDRLDWTSAEKETMEFHRKLREERDSRMQPFEIAPSSVEALLLRLQTDLFSSLETVYRENRSSTTAGLVGGTPAANERRESDANVVMRTWSFCERWEKEGSLHPREVREVVDYCTRKGADAAYPLVLYGGSGIGRSFVLGAAAQALRRLYLAASQERNPMQQPRLVVPLFVSLFDTPSVVCFLWQVLVLFQGTSSQQDPCESLDALMEKTRKTIQGYSPDNIGIDLIISGAELLDLASRRGEPSLHWLPTHFPGHVRIVLGVATDSPFLPTMRQRQPQPYETLIMPLPLVAQMNRFLGSFNSWRQEASARCQPSFPEPIPGFDPVVVLRPDHYEHEICTVDGQGRSPAGKTVEADNQMAGSECNCAQRLLRKEEADLSMYAFLLPPLLALDGVPSTEQAMFKYVDAVVPETCEALVVMILQRLEKSATKQDRDTMEFLLLAICVGGLISVPAMVALAETVGKASRFSALPVLLSLRNHRLVSFTNDGTVRPPHAKVCRAILAYYGTDAVDSSRAVVAHHLDEQLERRTHSAPQAFRLIPNLLLLNNQSHRLLEHLLDAHLLEDLLAAPGMRPYLVDAALRYLHHVEEVQEIGLFQDDEASASPEDAASVATDSSAPLATAMGAPFRKDRKTASVREILLRLQTLPLNLFQASLLLADNSPLYHAAALVESATPLSYPALRPLNKYTIERTSFASVLLSPGDTFVHCSVLDESSFVACSKAGMVGVWNLKDGRSLHSFTVSSAAGELLGAHSSDGDTIVCVSMRRLTIWTPKTGSVLELDGFTSTIDPIGAYGFSNKSLLCAWNESLKQIHVLNMRTGKPNSIWNIADLLPPTAPIREVRLCGDNIFLASLYEAILFTNNGPVTLAQNSVIHKVNSTIDGKLIATTSGMTLFVWTAVGACEHICEGHVVPINDVNFSPNGSLIVSASGDGQLLIWSSISGQQVRSVQSTLSPCGYCAFTADATKIIGRCGPYLQAWDAMTFEEVGAVRSHEGPIEYLHLYQNVAVTISASELKSWSTRDHLPTVFSATQQLLSDSVGLSGHIAEEDVSIEQVVMNPTRSILLTISSKKVLDAWSILLPSRTRDFRSCKVAASTTTRLFPSQHQVQTAVFLDSDTFFRVRDHGIERCSVEDGKVLHRQNILATIDRDAEFRLVANVKNDRLLLVANYSDGVRIISYELKSLQLVAQIVGHSAPVVGCAFLNDSIITASGDASIRIWASRSNAERFSFIHQHPITAFAALPGNEFFAADSQGRAFIVHLTANGIEVLRHLPESVGVLEVASHINLCQRYHLQGTSHQSPPARSGVITPAGATSSASSPATATTTISGARDFIIGSLASTGDLVVIDLSLGKVVNMVSPVLGGTEPKKHFQVASIAAQALLPCAEEEGVIAPFTTRLPWICAGTRSGNAQIFEVLY